jgi:hypothetical protein
MTVGGSSAGRAFGFAAGADRSVSFGDTEVGVGVAAGFGALAAGVGADIAAGFAAGFSAGCVVPLPDAAAPEAAGFDSGVGEAVATVRSSRVVSAGTSVVSGLSGEVTSCP